MPPPLSPGAHNKSRQQRVECGGGVVARGHTGAMRSRLRGVLHARAPVLLVEDPFLVVFVLLAQKAVVEGHCTGSRRRGTRAGAAGGRTSSCDCRPHPPTRALGSGGKCPAARVLSPPQGLRAMKRVATAAEALRLEPHLFNDTQQHQRHPAPPITAAPRHTLVTWVGCDCICDHAPQLRRLAPVVLHDVPNGREEAAVVAGDDAPHDTAAIWQRHAGRRRALACSAQHVFGGQTITDTVSALNVKLSC